MTATLAGVLAEASVRSLAAAFLVGGVLFAARVRASGVRHAAWTGVLSAMLLMPALPSLVPALPLPSPVPEMAPVDMLFRTSIDPVPMDGAIAPGDGPSAPTLRQPTTPAESAAPDRSTLPTLIPILMPAALVLYGFVMCVLLVRLVRGWLAAARIARTGVVVDTHSGGASIVVVESPAVCVPVTVGILYPSIVLPMAWRTWPESKLGAVLAHERAHVRRRDPLVQFLARVNCCLFWVHPLAWWLQGKLATTAEHAADEAAIQETGEGRRYAEVLLDMAETVRQTGGRLTWHGVGVGVDGSGLLGERIDRILSGRLFGAISRRRKLFVALACATTILIVVACRPSATPAPLKPNADVAERIEKQKAGQDFARRAARMTAAEVDAIEASLRVKPDDLEAWKKLHFFYRGPAARTLGWNEMVRRRLPHVLWLIDHHPDLDNVWLISASADAGGYAEAKKHWLAQTGRSGASAKTFSNAAYFFVSDDPALAEKFILQARTLDPDATTVAETGFPRSPAYWSRRLGLLYGDVLRGPLPQDYAPLPPLATDLFAMDVRKRLEESKDAVLLHMVGSWIDRDGGGRDGPRRRLGLHFLELAVELDPQLTEAGNLLISRRRGFERAKWSEPLRTKQAELAGGDFPTKVRTRAKLTRDEQEKLRSFEYEAVSSLPEADRFICLQELTDHAYMSGESLAYTMKDKVGADAYYQRSKKAAEALLALAEKHRERADYGEAIYRANIALGLHAIREGDRKRAVRYMVAAGNAPASEPLATASFMALDYRLTDWLLKDGERESVASFFDKSAQLRPRDRARLTKDAAAIRAGRMPESYQYRMTRT